jgi:Protein of unknown function (DUF4019)
MHAGAALVMSALLLAPRASSTQAKPEDLAAPRAEAWLALVDQGQYAQSWDEAAELFKGAVTREQWAAAAKGARAPLGRLVSRQLKSARYAESLPGAPDGKYVVLQYAAVFENKRSAVETVTPMLDPDGAWRVSGYYVK